MIFDFFKGVNQEIKGLHQEIKDVNQENKGREPVYMGVNQIKKGV